MTRKPQAYHGKRIRSLELEDFCISLTRHRGDTDVGLHYHEKPFVCFLIHGAYSETNSRSTEILEPGIALFRAAGYVHSNSFFDEGGVFLNLELNNLNRFAEENPITFPENNFARIASLDLYKVLRGFELGTSDDSLNILCYEAFLDHFDLLPAKGSLDWIRQVKERIHDEPTSRISLSRMSRELGLHPNYVVRKFKSVTGYKLSEYLNKVRTERCLAEMLSSEKTITDIAHGSGFFDQSHFSKVFRRRFNCSPGEFRKFIRG